MTIIAPVRSSCRSPIATWLFSREAGKGHPHIMCPIDMYMRTARNPADAANRLISTGVSMSFRASSSYNEPPVILAVLFVLLSAGLSALLAALRPVLLFVRLPARFFCSASYPALRTAAIISSASAVPSTPIELVSRLTEQSVTPLTAVTAFSTRAEQAAQLMPLTVYLSIVSLQHLLKKGSVSNYAPLKYHLC